MPNLGKRSNISQTRVNSIELNCNTNGRPNELKTSDDNADSGFNEAATLVNKTNTFKTIKRIALCVNIFGVIICSSLVFNRAFFCITK